MSSAVNTNWSVGFCRVLTLKFENFQAHHREENRAQILYPGSLNQNLLLLLVHEDYYAARAEVAKTLPIVVRTLINDGLSVTFCAASTACLIALVFSSPSPTV